MTKVGIIICDRYKSCDGVKCFRSVRKKDGGFAYMMKLRLWDIPVVGAVLVEK